MPTVELRIGALPSHVRTARLISAAVARRCGVDDAVIDEVKLAVGEACARAVSLNAEHAPEQQVVVELVDGVAEFTVAVLDHGPADGFGVATGAVESVVEVSLVGDSDGREPPPAHLGLALISALVDQFAVEREGQRTAVRMRWTLPTAAQ